MPGRSWSTAAALACSLGLADAAYAKSYDIPPGTLGEVAAALGAKAAITIAVPEPDLAARRSPGVRGNLSVRAAVSYALRGTGAEAIFYDKFTIRIVRKRASPSRPAPKPKPKPAPASAPKREDHVDPVDIIVTASKQNMLLDNFPGSAKSVKLEPDWVARNASRGTAAITEALPTVSSTNLGRGRNKIYLRGIADSSFNGPTQATVGQYLGDVRINYSAPDLDLNLYDLDRVELLTGPQGTLYGAGSLGGIMRLVPNAPDSHAAHATASLGLSATRFGGIGGDAAAMLNLPVIEGHAALRLVVHGAHEPGYIDDPSRGLRDINSSRIHGQRLTLRIDDVAGWRIDVGGVYQSIANRDGQYTLRGDPPLVRNNVLAQPFRSKFQLAYVTGRRRLGSNELVLTTSFARQDLTSVFDATGSDGTALPRRFEERNDNIFLSHETRLSGGDPQRPWVAGLAGVFNISRLTRMLGRPDAPERIVGVRNGQQELSLFGQASLPIGKRLNLTLGGRVAFSASAGELLDDALDRPPESTKTRLHFAPTIAVNWHIADSLSIYSHYQQGFRAGGFAVSPAGSATGGQEFLSDELTQVELGIRWRSKERDRLSIRAAAFAVDWGNIQADLVDDAGLPYTANIGSGRIFGVDSEITWRASPALTLTAAVFINDSFLNEAPAERSQQQRNTLPNIAADGARLGAQWRIEVAHGVTLTGDASLRYVGVSDLGADPSLGTRQGNYFVGGAGARIDFSRFGISLDIANLTDTRANSFAFGNPFGLRDQNQVTPLRPRTVRLGFDVRF